MQIVNPLKVPPSQRKSARLVSSVGDETATKSTPQQVVTVEPDSNIASNPVPQAKECELFTRLVTPSPVAVSESPISMDSSPIDDSIVAVTGSESVQTSSPSINETATSDTKDTSLDSKCTSAVVPESVVGEIDNILSMIRQTSNAETTTDLSSRLVDLAMKLQTKKGTEQALPGSGLQIGDNVAIEQQKPAEAVTPVEIKDDKAVTDIVETNPKHIMDVNLDVDKKEETSSQSQTCVNKVLTAPSLSPLPDKVIPPLPAKVTSEVVPSLSPSVDKLTEEKADDDERCHTPVQDDTYDMNEEIHHAKEFLQNILDEEEKNIAKQSVGSPGYKAAADRLEVCKILKTVLNKPDANVDLIADIVEKVYKEPPDTISPKLVMSMLSQSPDEPGSDLASSERWYYVFDPRGHQECMDMDGYLEKLNGTRFHPHNVNDIVKGCLSGTAKDRSSSQIPVTKEMLEKSIPSHGVWIVMRYVRVRSISHIFYRKLPACHFLPTSMRLLSIGMHFVQKIKLYCTVHETVSCITYVLFFHTLFFFVYLM